MSAADTTFLCLYQDITHAQKVSMESLEAASPVQALEQFITHRQAEGWGYQDILVQSAPQIIALDTSTIYRVDNYGELQPLDQGSYRGLKRSDP